MAVAVKTERHTLQQPEDILDSLSALILKVFHLSDLFNAVPEQGFKLLVFKVRSFLKSSN